MIINDSNEKNKCFGAYRSGLRHTKKNGQPIHAARYVKQVVILLDYY
jgi:hypothetical protein